MNRLVRNAVLSVAVAATTLATMPMAQAGERWRHDNRRPVVVRQQNDAGALIAAGILGLAVGAIVVGASQSAQPDRVYDNPYRHPRPRPVRDPFPRAPEGRFGGGYAEFAGGYQPWSPEWYRWCSRTYRSFDPSTGTYTLYPGVERFCVVE
jgi:hypothetical protein